MPPLVIEGISNNTSLDSSKEENIFDMTFLFAAPKSKVFSKLFSLLMVLRLTSWSIRQISPSRKRQKHIRYFPDKVAWVRCDRCGEPKRPHRICSDQAEICAMRPEEYEAYKAKNGESKKTVEAKEE